MASRTIIVSPFLRRGKDTKHIMGPLLISLTILALLFSLRYDSHYFTRFCLTIGFGLLVEILYTFLRDIRLSPPSPSTAVTSALLVLSVPSHMALPQVFGGVVVAILFGKMLVDKEALRLNPMLIGRLFLMLVFPDAIQEWQNPSVEIDALTSATPLGLYLSEGVSYGLPHLLLGSVGGLWEGFMAIIPGSPGDIMPLVTILMSVILYFMGILDWRPATTFILGFGVTTHFLGMPVLFSILSGSIIFTAVFIITDPRTTPGSKSGRILAGLIAGILNAFIRNHGYYPEGVVIAILAVNLLSPTLDTLAFHLRGWQLTQSSRKE